METNGQEQIAAAIIAVMKAVKGIDKTMTVGTGNSSYKGVPDQEVKKIIGEAMAKHGLAILPIGVQAKTEVSRWTETSSQYGEKQKQSVFTEVNTRYMLLHESGQSIILEGYGHGVDAQDKGAGKATTYALKYTLLYSFLVPTGKIDDADVQHSNDMDAPPNPLMQEVMGAIAKLTNVNSEDEMKAFADTLPAHIKTDMRFREAAVARRNSYPKAQAA